MKEYTAESITVLSDIEHMRQRSGMYIGSGEDPRQLLSEIIDNSIDEVQNGFSPNIRIDVNTKENVYSVRDYGRGIPHGTKKLESGEEKEIIEVLLTKANSGGKFNNDAYLHSSGLHGLGITITNALSVYIDLTSYRKGKFVRGHSEGGKATYIARGITPEKDGTLTVFKPDPQFFVSPVIPIDFIIKRCSIANALLVKVDLFVDGVKQDIEKKFFDLIEDDSSISIYCDSPIFEVTNKKGEEMKVGIRYTSDTKDKSFGFTNMLPNSMGGTHVNCLVSTLSDAWSEFLDSHKNLKPDVQLRKNDFLVGMRDVCAVFIEEPNFSSQTKEKLDLKDKHYFDEIMLAFKKQFKKWLEDEIDTTQRLLKRFEEYRISQNSLLSRKEISSIIKVNTDDSENIRRRSVVSKLVECTSKSRKDTELFVVEGNSACLRWNTMIRLANDTEATIKEVCDRVNSGETLYVYGKIPKGTHNSGPNVYRVLGGGVTRRNAKLYRAHFDNGTYVDCTEDHKFMLVDRSFKELKDLTESDSLSTMAYHSDRFHIGDFEHLHRNIYSKYNGEIPDGYFVHHIDGNHFNNYPDNLMALSNSEHTSLHNICNLSFKEHVGDVTPLKDYWKKEESREIQSRLKKEWFSSEENRKKTSVATKIGMSKMTKEDHRNRIYLQRYSVSLAYYKDLINYRKIFDIDTIFDKEKYKEIRRADGKLHSTLHMYPQSFMSTYGISTKEELLNLIMDANHRLVSVEDLNIFEDVYDIEVEEVHNFCLANDIIVHNCGPYLCSRNKEKQAVLPLRGKILNITGLTVKDAIQNQEVCDIINSIGCGIGSSCDSSKSRYDRVIISADADPDGLQINCLVLTLFINLLPDMVKDGRVYISLPPLYCWGTSVKDYGWCNKVEDIPSTAKNVHRFKGLGEMNDDQLKYFLVDPSTRNIMKVTYPSNIDEFNKILGTSEGKYDLLKATGILC